MRRLIGGDFSNVEGRINAWLAGEDWKIEAFAAYDTILGEMPNGKLIRGGPDLYEVTAASIVGVAIEAVTKAQRQAQGKIPELACGYQGGVGAFITMGDTYNVKPWDMVKPVRQVLPPEAWDALAAKYAGAKDKHGLPLEQWTAIKSVVLKWRAAHPCIVSSWWELQDAAIQAVVEQGVPVPVYGGRCAYLCDGRTLWLRFPSGRLMAYNAPWVEKVTEELVKLPYAFGNYAAGVWHACENFFPHELEKFQIDGAEFWTRSRYSVRFKGIHPETKQWVTKYLYGGLQCENIVQGTARCLMDHAMLRVEDAGYPLILTVHDELLTEPFENFGSVQEFKELMEISPGWAQGLPISAGVWEDTRYVK